MNHTSAYTTIVSWSNDVDTQALQTDGQKSFVAEELVDRYSLEVENLGQKEWKKLFQSVKHYLATVR